jgi:mono/diheme cytochrome c family protein
VVLNRLSLGRWIVVLLFAALAIVWVSQRTPAQAQSVDEGRSIFEARCVACHTIGGGALVGPDLEGVTSRRDRDWLARWIATPDVMLAEGDPIATQMLAEFNNIPMPNLGLTDAEVESLISFLETADPAAGPATPPTVLDGDAAIGKRMFEGVVRFENGGPPCLACHSVAGIGAFGGTLGPDLTQASDKYGAGNLASLLSNPPFPTMNPIFVEGERLLTEQELAHLAAFLEQASVSGRSTDALAQLVLLGGFGAALLLLLTRLVWRDRLTEVRRPMVVRSRARIARYAERELHIPRLGRQVDAWVGFRT